MTRGDRWFHWCTLRLLQWTLVANLLSSSFIPNTHPILSQGFVVRQAHRSGDDSELRNTFSSQSSFGTSNSEIAHVSFVTGLRHKRDLSQNEYHIVRLYRQETNQTIEIHLVKREAITSPDFTFVVKNGDKVEDEDSNFNNTDGAENNCLYDGIITSEADGKAAFSVCGKQPGFSGIIVTNSGNWIIEPQKDTDKGQVEEDGDIFTTSVPTVIPHIISRADSSSGDRSHQSLAVDELHVPAEELEKAAELAKAEAAGQAQRDLKDNNNSTGPGSDQSGDDDDDGDEGEGVDQEEDATFLTPNSEENGDSAVNIEIMASPTKRPIRASKNRHGNKRAATTTGGRRSGSTLRTPKAATTGSQTAKKIVIEIAVFTDDDFYEQMKIRYPKETSQKIREYVLTMVHAMDLLYQQETLGTNVHFKLVHLEIQKKRPSRLNSHGGKAKSYLTSFCDYAGDLNKNNNLWDHALLLTGHDLIEEGTSSTAGLAWAGTMCYRYYSCSISEGTQFGSVFIITHEIGHSMGMEHDGMGVSKSCDEDKYLMSPTTGPGKVTWSTCSGQNLKDFLKYGTSELRGRKSSVLPVCMTTSSREAKNIEYSSSTLPGQKYDATKQCVLSMGKKYTPVMRKDTPFNNICTMLYCGNGTHAISTHPALDGTECAMGKECKGGQCDTPSSKSR